MVLPSFFGRCGIVTARATETIKSSRENALYLRANARLITSTFEHFQGAFHECHLKSLPTGRRNTARQHAPVLRITPLRLWGDAPVLG
jgi:hypothetical protein